MDIQCFLRGMLEVDLVVVHWVVLTEVVE